METRPIGNDARRATRERRLGPDAACCVCGEENIDVLRKGSRSMLSMLDLHHFAGRANDDLTVILCLNDHALQTAAMSDLGVSLRRSNDRTVLERLQAVLAGLATFLSAVAERLRTYARELTPIIAHLRSCPVAAAEGTPS